ncbi:MAG: ABC transporter substrate-binding protein [Bacteroidetes bacterium]|nr:ABC transporter substrate-binding protein [Bacteroidota bacterium]
MRVAIHLAIVLMVVLTLIGACAPSQPTVAPAQPSVAAAPTAAAGPPTPVAAAPAVPTAAPTPTAAPKIKRGGTLTVADSFTLTGLDPQISTGYNPSLPAIFDNLLKLERVGDTDRFEIKGDLAESWDITDPKTIVFKLRKGVKFHDGSDWNAEIAKWNVDRWLSHPKFRGKQLVQDIASAEVVDAYTLKMNLKEPSAPTLVYLTPGSATGEASPSTMMVSKAAMDKLGEAEFASHPVGTGSMQFGNWLRDDNVTMKRFDQYWKTGADGKPLPYLDAFVWRFRPDSAVTVAELRTGAADITYRLPAKDLTALKNDPNIVETQLPWANRTATLDTMNTKKGAFKDNLKLRQAAWYALDREGMAKALGFGFAKPALYPLWTPGILGYDETLPRYDYNPEKAKQLVKDAGFPNGVDVTHLVIAREPDLTVVQAIKNNWDAVGIRTTIDPAERTAAINKTRLGDFDVYSFGPTSAPDPDATGGYFLPGGANNRIQYENPKLTQLMADARSVYDPKKREEIYKQVQRVLYDDAYWGGSFYTNDYVVTNKSVKGLKVQFEVSVLDIDEVWLDR